MPRSTPTSLLLDDLVRNARQASDSAYLVSVALIAAVIICVFFGIGLSLIAVQTKEPMSSTVAVGDRGTEVTLPYSEVLYYCVRTALHLLQQGRTWPPRLQRSSLGFRPSEGSR
jgi:hypothetical protein